jgi:hypothetical protein
LYDAVESEVVIVNKTLPVFTAATFGLLTSLILGGSLYRLPALSAAVVGAIIWGCTVAVASGLQRPTSAEGEVPRPPVIAAGTVWGVGV